MSTSTASFIISFSMISYPWIRQRWSHERPRQAHLEVLAPAAPPFESICYENVLPQWEDLVNWLYWCFFVPGKGRAPCWSRSGPQGLPNSRWVRIQSLEGVHSQIYSVWLKRYTRQNAFVVSLFPASSMTAGPRWPGESGGRSGRASSWKGCWDQSHDNEEGAVVVNRVKFSDASCSRQKVKPMVPSELGFKVWEVCTPVSNYIYSVWLKRYTR